jgi:hypothetical protein
MAIPLLNPGSRVAMQNAEHFFAMSIHKKHLYQPEDVSFRPAGSVDYPLLYRLLIERYEQPETNIRGMARSQLPTWNQHVRYLDGQPYARIEIIVVDGEGVGMWYLTHENVAGCFVLRSHIARGVGLAACYRFLCEVGFPVATHVNPANRRAWRTVERLGFVLTERSDERLTYHLYGLPTNPFKAAAVGSSAEGAEPHAG